MSIELSIKLIATKNSLKIQCVSELKNPNFHDFESVKERLESSWSVL